MLIMVHLCACACVYRSIFIYIVAVFFFFFFAYHFNLLKPEYKRKDSSIYQTFNRVERAVGSKLDPWKLNDNVVTIETSLMTKMKCARDELTSRHFNCEGNENTMEWNKNESEMRTKRFNFLLFVFFFHSFVLSLVSGSFPFCLSVRLRGFLQMIVYPYFLLWMMIFKPTPTLYANTNDWKDLLRKLDEE